MPTNVETIAQQKNKSSFQTVSTQYDVKRVVQRCPAVLHQPQQTAAHMGGQRQGVKITPPTLISCFFPYTGRAS